MLSGVLGGLRIRLILLMLLALFPISLIAVWQTDQVVDDTLRLTRERLVDLTRAAAAEQQSQISRAIGAAVGLGVTVPQMELPDCRDAMARFLESTEPFAFAGYIRADGVMECSSAGDKTVDFSGYEGFKLAVERADIFVEVNKSGAVSGQPVVIINVPVLRDGALDGFVSLSIPQVTSPLVEERPAADRFVYAGISSTGEAFDFSAEPEGSFKHLPRDIPMQTVLDRAGTTFEAIDQTGERRLFSVTAPIAESYAVVGSWPVSDPLRDSLWIQAFMPLLFAVLMWTAGMLVAYFGLSRLVLRHLADLRSAMRKFALGERRSHGLVLEGAPEEFKDAERAFNRMALLITQAEAQQLTDLHDKEVLLREVHHRVKNNLQMIASIMSIQARSADTDEAREMLQGLHRRVRGMAMLHNSLYSRPDTSLVDAGELVNAVVTDTAALLPDSSQKIETSLVSFMLYPDQAVPLSMWLAEAMTNAVKYSGSIGDASEMIRVDLKHDESGLVTLTVENTIGDTSDDGAAYRPDGSGLGTSLMAAFCRQLEGEDDITVDAEHFKRVLRFTIQGFDAETSNGKRAQRATG